MTKSYETKFLDNITTYYEGEGIIVFTGYAIPYKARVNIYNGEVETDHPALSEISKTQILEEEHLINVLTRILHHMGLQNYLNEFDVSRKFSQILLDIEKTYGNYKQIVYVLHKHIHYKSQNYKSPKIDNWFHALEEKEVESSVYPFFIEKCIKQIFQSLRVEISNLQEWTIIDEKDVDVCVSFLNLISKIQNLHQFQFYCLENPSIAWQFSVLEELFTQLKFKFMRIINIIQPTKFI